jgi:hypothetical protein
MLTLIKMYIQFMAFQALNAETNSDHIVSYLDLQLCTAALAHNICIESITIN